MKIAVIGAGVTGLATAYGALRAGFEPLLLEAGPRVGGVLESFSKDGFLVDFGANSLRVATPELTALLAELGLDPLDAQPGQDIRRIVRSGRLQTLPRSQWGLLTTGAWSLKAKLRLLAEPWVPVSTQEDEPFAEFISRRLGPELLDYAADPFVSGIYAADPQKLSLRYAFPKLYKMEREQGSLIKGFLKARGKSLQRPRTVSFRGGMGDLPEALACAVGAERIRLNARITGLDPANKTLEWEDALGAHKERFDAVVVTVPAWAVPQLPWPGVVQKRLSFLQNIPYAPLSVLALGFRKQDLAHPCDGFGFLVPSREQRPFLGTIFSSSLFQGRAPEGMCLLTQFIGGMRQPHLAALPTEVLVKSVCQELHLLLGLRADPAFVAHRFWPQAVAQYGLEHGLVLKELSDFEAEYPGWSFLGHFRSGVSLPQCLEAGLAWAKNYKNL